MQPGELKELCTILNPDKVEGRLILITRYGADKIGAMLPGHIKAVQESGVPVVWQCDGVHGNTVTASNKLKTRNFDDVMAECTRALQIHRENGSILAGIHIELTGQASVTECTGTHAPRIARALVVSTNAPIPTRSPYGNRARRALQAVAPASPRRCSLRTTRRSATRASTMLRQSRRLWPWRLPSALADLFVELLMRCLRRGAAAAWVGDACWRRAPRRCGRLKAECDREKRIGLGHCRPTELGEHVSGAHVSEVYRVWGRVRIPRRSAETERCVK